MTRSQLRRKLRAPLPPEAISDNPATGLSSIDVNYVTERLNDCFGESGWTAKYEVIEKGQMIVVRCDLVINRWGIIRQAFGGNSMEDRGDAYKSACSDSLKKCASQIGIAHEVYKGKSLAKVAPVTLANFAPARLFKGSRYGVIDGVVQYLGNMDRKHEAGFPERRSVKAHIVVSEEAIEQNQDRVALCKSKVPSAVFVTWIQSSRTPLLLENMRGICRKCIAEMMNPHDDRTIRYFYVVLSGEEEISARHRTAEL